MPQPYLQHASSSASWVLEAVAGHSSVTRICPQGLSHAPVVIERSLLVSLASVLLHLSLSLSLSIYIYMSPTPCSLLPAPCPSLSLSLSLSLCLSLSLYVSVSPTIDIIHMRTSSCIHKFRPLRYFIPAGRMQLPNVFTLRIS